MHAKMLKVFDNAYLSDQTDYVARAVSHAIQLPAESVVLHGTLINHAGTDITLTLQMEGSYDGQVWLTTGLEAVAQIVEFKIPTSPEAKSSTAIALDYAFVRYDRKLWTVS